MKTHKMVKIPITTSKSLRLLPKLLLLSDQQSETQRFSLWYKKQKTLEPVDVGLLWWKGAKMSAHLLFCQITDHFSTKNIKFYILSCFLHCYLATSQHAHFSFCSQVFVKVPCWKWPCDFLCLFVGKIALSWIFKCYFLYSVDII